ncbi:MAG: GNAT family N-acetyltransferase [Oscillospiraceae bacterium]|nr:GNAT family N-acetyltransferase [Oscillospiraceae bacterium]
MNDGAHLFFQKRGYIHSWGDTGCYDMDQMLEDFSYNEHSIGDTINGITYRWAEINDLDSILICVSDADKSFIQYYQNEDLYQKDSNELILIAEKNKEVLGAIMLNINFLEDMGSVGATATIQKYRNMGIATNMVLLGTKYLKDIGLSRAFIGYTYTQIVHMYGKAGYKICMEYFMGEKLV